jgi:hypothetical protein
MTSHLYNLFRRFLPLHHTGPNGDLLTAARKKGWRTARRDKGRWVHRVSRMSQIETADGPVNCLPGDVLCMSESGALWLDNSKYVRTNYKATSQRKHDKGRVFVWYVPTNSVKRMAVRLEATTHLKTKTGTVVGKADDWLMIEAADRNRPAPECWIMSKTGFEHTYSVR